MAYKIKHKRRKEKEISGYEFDTKQKKNKKYDDDEILWDWKVD